MIRTALVSACALAALGSAADAAPAASALGGPPIQRVRYADLDLSTAQGEAQLQRRITIAVKEVCGEWDGRNLSMKALRDTCRRAAIAGAAPRMADAVARARAKVQLASAVGTVPPR